MVPFDVRWPGSHPAVLPLASLSSQPPTALTWSLGCLRSGCSWLCLYKHCLVRTDLFLQTLPFFCYSRLLVFLSLSLTLLLGGTSCCFSLSVAQALHSQLFFLMSSYTFSIDPNIGIALSCFADGVRSCWCTRLPSQGSVPLVSAGAAPQDPRRRCRVPSESGVLRHVVSPAIISSRKKRRGKWGLRSCFWAMPQDSAPSPSSDAWERAGRWHSSGWTMAGVRVWLMPYGWALGGAHPSGDLSPLHNSPQQLLTPESSTKGKTSATEAAGRTSRPNLWYRSDWNKAGSSSGHTTDIPHKGLHSDTWTQSLCPCPDRLFSPPAHGGKPKSHTWPVAPVSISRTELWFKLNTSFIAVGSHCMGELQSLRQRSLAEAMLGLTPSCCCQTRVVLCPTFVVLCLL